MLNTSNPPNKQYKESYCRIIFFFTDFEEIAILYEGIKKMVVNCMK